MDKTWRQLSARRPPQRHTLTQTRSQPSGDHAPTHVHHTRPILPQYNARLPHSKESPCLIIRSHTSTRYSLPPANASRQLGNEDLERREGQPVEQERLGAARRVGEEQAPLFGAQVE